MRKYLFCLIITIVIFSFCSCSLDKTDPKTLSTTISDSASVTEEKTETETMQSEDINISETTAELISEIVTTIKKETKNTEVTEKETLHETATENVTVPETSKAVKTTSKKKRTAEQILSDMSLRDKVLQMFIVTPEQLSGLSKVTSFGTATEKGLKSNPVGGVIYFAQNIVDRQQVINMISGIQSASEIGLFISVDEEGGKVSRIGKNAAMGATYFGPMSTINTESAAYNVGNTLGNDLKKLGFNLDFAPVADVYSNPKNTVIGNRAFSSDPEIAAKLVASCVKGFKNSGTLCCLKHFPGHGDTEADSHYGEAEISKTMDELKKCEFIPFEAGIKAGADFVMVGHITVPNVIEEKVPATLSKKFITDILKNQLNFKGLIITDSMKMEAITKQYDSGTAAVMAITAGVDIILMPQNLSKAVEGIINAVNSGQISESRINESVLHILNVKIQNGII